MKSSERETSVLLGRWESSDTKEDNSRKRERFHLHFPRRPLWAKFTRKRYTDHSLSPRGESITGPSGAPRPRSLERGRGENEREIGGTRDHSLHPSWTPRALVYVSAYGCNGAREGPRRTREKRNEWSGTWAQRENKTRQTRELR